MADEKQPDEKPEQSGPPKIDAPSAAGTDGDTAASGEAVAGERPKGRARKAAKPRRSKPAADENAPAADENAPAVPGGAARPTDAAPSVAATVAAKFDETPANRDEHAAADATSTVTGTDDTGGTGGMGRGATLPSSVAKPGGWLSAGRLGWLIAAVLAVVLVIGYSSLSDETASLDAERSALADQVSSLRAQLGAERQAIADYPNAVAALEAVEAELADAEALRADAEAAKAELAGLQQKTDELSDGIAALEAERGRLDGVATALAEDVAALTALLDTMRGRLNE